MPSLACSIVLLLVPSTFEVSILSRLASAQYRTCASRSMVRPLGQVSPVLTMVCSCVPSIDALSILAGLPQSVQYNHLLVLKVLYHEMGDIKIFALVNYIVTCDIATPKIPHQFFKLMGTIKVRHV